MEKPIYKNSLKPLARTLRKNATRQENHLWYDFLRSYPVRFRRQRPIESYVVDLYCEEAQLVVELDGSQHYSEKGKKEDEKRSQRLQELGLTILRFSNRQVDQEFDGVCETIHNTVKQRLGRDPYGTK